jgi:hypothetical protein
MSELGGHGGFGTAAQAMVTVTPPTHLLTVTADPPDGGTVTGSGAYVSGAVASVTATAAPGWTFLYWTGPVTDPDAAATTVLMDADTTVTAHFAQTWFEDDDPALDYTGTWVDYVHVAASGGHARVSSETGAQVTFAFTGTGISCRTAKGPLMGKAQAWLDGAGPMLIDLYARSLQVVTLSKTDLALGAHTLTIRVSGLKNWRSSGRNVAIDALEVVP